MTTNFPSSIDAFTNPTSADTLDNPPHDQQHADINDAMEAVQAKIGVDGSAVTSSLDYKVNALPAGVIGYGELEADQFWTTSYVDITNLSVTFTADSSRLYKASFIGLCGPSSFVIITDGSNNQLQQLENNSVGFVSVGGFVLLSGISGSYTVKARGKASTTGASYRLEAANVRPATLIVEDVGGS